MDGRKNNKGTKGNKGGRKPKAEELDLITKIDSVVNEEGWKAVLNKIFQEAKQGSYNHTKLLLEYRFGKPKETVNFNDITEDKPPSILNFKDYGDKQ